MPDDDCGHDLEAFQRQATELAEVRAELVEAVAERDEARRRLDLATAAGRQALDERDQAIAALHLKEG